MFQVNCFCVEGNYVGRMDTPPAQDQDHTYSGPRTYSDISLKPSIRIVIDAKTDSQLHSHITPTIQKPISSRRMNGSLTHSVENSHSGRAVLMGNRGGVGTASPASSLLNTLTHSQDQWLQRFIRGHAAKALSVRVWAHQSSHTDRAISPFVQLLHTRKKVSQSELPAHFRAALHLLKQVQVKSRLTVRTRSSTGTRAARRDEHKLPMSAYLSVYLEACMTHKGESAAGVDLV